MLKAYKTEIKPTKEQIQKINQSIGICRWLYNQYLAKNQELYKQFKEGLIDKKQAFISANDFDKYINNEVKVQDEYSWINKCSSKARNKSICNAETAYKRFFNGKSGFPRFKKKNKQEVKLYFPKNNKTDFRIERHRINIPTLKWVRFKEKGYIPTDKKVVNGTVSQKGNRYFISIIIEEDVYSELNPTKNEGIGIDVGVKNLAVCSNGMTFKNINKTHQVKKLEKKLKREQRKLSRKYESLKLRNKKEKGGTATRQNIQKQIAKVQKLHQKLTNIRTDYINKVINSIVKQNPSYITIEDLAISNMMKNRHLSKAISQQKLYEFRVKLTYKCMIHNIELRVVDRWYPSSKMCSSCGNINKNLKLKDRIYKCECGVVLDRDINASYNLKNAKIYKVA
ncbi:transposase [Tepidibacter formicigenes DSM 15518]|uniref:Transposase n=1 Tax=Tepidibacter formicigenes DSM 15518 TaxID=1123349 RepID=A0A1M6SYQ6_9FIRM|nr:transposase [Tepidibacter formicigenes DSM 15518]